MVEGNVLTLGLNPKTSIIKCERKGRLPSRKPAKVNVGNQVTQTKPSMWDLLLRD